MALIRNQVPQNPQDGGGVPPQEKPRPTLREHAIKSAKKSTLLCIAFAILAIPLSVIDRSHPTFFGNLFAYWGYCFGLWIFLMILSFFIGPTTQVWWKKTTEASQNFWDQRL